MASAPTLQHGDMLAYSVAHSAKSLALSRAEIYNRINRGELRAKKHGRRTIILHDDLQAYLLSLPDYVPAAA